MQQVAFKQVDVFTRVPMLGNPLAVILDARGLSDQRMQQIANWTNLSETTFVLPPTRPEADYRLRIFTTARELPFAGHPSIGTAHALIEAGMLQPRSGRWVQECGAGLLPLRMSGNSAADRSLYVQVPRARIAAAEASVDRRLESALNCVPESIQQARIVNVGAVWLIADVGSAAKVRALTPSPATLQQLASDLGITGMTVFGRENGGAAQLAVRSFCPGEGMFEDPVCGSGNASVAAYLHAQGRLQEIGQNYRASQGRELGRDGYVDVSVDAEGGIEIGGAAITCIDGSINLE
jgi:PhzF family phenazine biosynthesis protein